MPFASIYDWPCGILAERDGNAYRDSLRPRAGGPGELTLKSRADADVISGKILKELDGSPAVAAAGPFQSTKNELLDDVCSERECAVRCLHYSLLRTHTHI